MAQHRWDAIVIGTGQSGPALARRIAGDGGTVAVIERARVGGTCVNTGCIPTKTLVATARVAHLARRAADFGVAIDGAVRVDFARAMARMREVSGVSRDAVTRGLEDEPGVTLIRGHGRLTSPTTVDVGGRSLAARRIFLNVGARAGVPPIEGLDDVPFLTNSSLLALDRLPHHLIVVGGSYIGLELGQVFRRFGSAVTILQRGDRLVPREDPDVSLALLDIVHGEGVVVHRNAECLAVARRGDGIVARSNGPDGAVEVEGSHLLIAAGRVPNTHDLGLERAGVATDAGGHVVVDDSCESSVPGIFALGDCNGRGGFTHTSYDDFRIVESRLFGGPGRSLADRVPTYALFTDPPLGRTGMNESQARASGRRVLAAKYEMENVGRAYERAETTGFLKVLVDADSSRILGASFLGIEADELIHVIVDAMRAGTPFTVIEQAMHIHPTVAEYLPVLLGALEPLAPA